MRQITGPPADIATSHQVIGRDGCNVEGFKSQVHRHQHQIHLTHWCKLMTIAISMLWHPGNSGYALVSKWDGAIMILPRCRGKLCRLNNFHRFGIRSWTCCTEWQNMFNFVCGACVHIYVSVDTCIDWTRLVLEILLTCNQVKLGMPDHHWNSRLVAFSIYIVYIYICVCNVIICPFSKFASTASSVFW